MDPDQKMQHHNQDVWSCIFQSCKFHPVIFRPVFSGLPFSVSHTCYFLENLVIIHFFHEDIDLNMKNNVEYMTTLLRG